MAPFSVLRGELIQVLSLVKPWEGQLRLAHQESRGQLEVQSWVAWLDPLAASFTAPFSDKFVNRLARITNSGAITNEDQTIRSTKSDISPAF